MPSMFSFVLLYYFIDNLGRTLKLLYQRLEEAHQILCEASHMSRLSCEEITISLLSALHEHLSKVSKMVVTGTVMYYAIDSWLAPWLERDLKVSEVFIRLPELLTDVFGLWTLSDLYKLDLQLGRLPVTVSWLPEISSVHPYLKKIRFIDDCKHYRLIPHMLPFMSSFDEEVHKALLRCLSYYTACYKLARSLFNFDRILSGVGCHWNGDGHHIILNRHPVSPFFISWIQNIEFPFWEESNVSHRTISTLLICWPPLQFQNDIIGLLRLFLRRFHFGWKSLGHGARTVFQQQKLENFMVYFRIAQRFSSLQAFFIQEEASLCEHLAAGVASSSSWLKVLNAHGGGREVVGKLCQTWLVSSLFLSLSDWTELAWNESMIYLS